MSAAVGLDARFALRACPLCGVMLGQPVFNLEASVFCSANPTYCENFRAELDLGDPAYFPIDRCGGCGFVYARFLPAEEFLNRVYERVIVAERALAESNGRGRISRRMAYLARLLQLAPDQSPLRACDFGCGYGETARLLAAVEVQVVGFDASASRTAHARGHGVAIARSLRELEPLAPFGIVVADNILEHLADPLAAVRSIAELSHPEAVLYVSVPSYEARFVRAQLSALAGGRPVDPTLNPWEHLNYFTVEHLDRLLGKGDFRPLRKRELVGVEPTIGLRPETAVLVRWKNGIASMGRLLRYLATGESIESTVMRFYRRV